MNLFDDQAWVGEFNYDAPPEPDITETELSAGSIEDFISSTTPSDGIVPVVTNDGFSWTQFVQGASQFLTAGAQAAGVYEISKLQSPTVRYAPNTLSTVRTGVPVTSRPRWLVPLLLAGGVYLLVK